jgi:serine/threonine-protein kinase
MDSKESLTGLSDRYRIERELGRGGMATVYLAHDVRHDRAVALKVLNQQLAALLGAERFLQEIRVTARLRHPNILPLFDSGEVNGQLFYVMPLVEGESLRARMSRQPRLTTDEAIRITREVADALDYAHAQGIIHRDVKPENLLLEAAHTMVADFGIARAARATDDSRLTRSGFSLGTPAYMSPEQVSGDLDLDGRSDLYSLACVLFEMLTGDPPFTGTNPDSVLVQRFMHPAPRLSTRRPDLPAGIDQAIARALARDPKDRFDRIARFAEALTDSAAATAGRVEKSIAVLPFANMSGDPQNDYFGDGIAEEIINALTQLPDLKVAARTSAFSFKGKNEDLRTVGERLGVSTVLEGSVRRAGSRVRITAQLIEVASGYHLWSERFDRELTDIFAIQDDIATGIAAKLKVTLGSDEAVADVGVAQFKKLDAMLPQLVKPRTENAEAYQLFLKGRALMRHRGADLATAVETLEQAIALDPHFASAHATLAQTLALLAFWGHVPSGEIREQSLAAAARAVSLDPELPDCHTADALTAITLNFDRTSASLAWERALALDPSNPDTRIYRALFDLAYTRLDWDGAIGEIEEAIARDPESAYAYTSHAVALAFAGRHEKALVSAERAVALDPASLYAQWSLLQPLGLLGRYDEALNLARKAMGKFGRHPWILVGISLASGRVGRRDTAESVYAELKGRAGLEPVQRTMLAAAALQAGHREEALALMREAVREKEALLSAAALAWPVFADLRTDPRYAEILAEMGWLEAP